MRVITGSARGRRVRTLPGEAVRPTAERVKEALFSVIHFELPGSRFLDLFAGSGQIGIEALSRGAEYAAFCDISREAVIAVRENIAACGFTDRAGVYAGDYAAFLAAYRDKFDFAFLDPPYRAGLLPDALTRVAGVMSERGVMIAEHPSQVSPPGGAGDFRAAKCYRYGKIALTFYRREEQRLE